MNCVVLAAGLGTRLRPLTNKTPKPAIIIKGKPIIRHVLDWLEDVGFDDILVKAHYLANQVKKAIGKDENVKFITESKLSPTAYFLKKNKDKLEDEFLVTNGDTLTDLDLLDFIEFHMVNKNIATVFTKHDAIHSGGTYIFDKEVLKYIREDMDIPDLMKSLIDKNILVNLYFSDAIYFDTATHEKLEKAQRLWKLK